MSKSDLYFADVHEPENELVIDMEEIKGRVSQLAEEAWEANEHSYKAYLSAFCQLVESYVANTNEQTVRGAIFMFACEHDYHLPSEIEDLSIDDLDDEVSQNRGLSPG